MDNSGAPVPGQALVSDQARAGLDPAGFDPSREVEPEPQIDDSFTGLQARQRKMFSDVLAERDRLRDYIATLQVNALRATGAARGTLVSFIAIYAGDIKNGMPQHEAIAAFEKMSKCSACGCVPGMLANGLCFDCAPEWPSAARDTDRSGEADETAQQAQPEGREPGSEGHRPDTPSQSQEPSK